MHGRPGAPGGRVPNGCKPRAIATKEDPVAELSSKQRAHLRSLAHELKPVVQIGAEGVTDAAVRTVEEAFRNRELLKVKVSDSAPGDVDETADAIRDAVEGVHVIQTIGRTAVLYRRDPEDPGIRLPE